MHFIAGPPLKAASLSTLASGSLRAFVPRVLSADTAGTPQCVATVH